MKNSQKSPIPSKNPPSGESNGRDPKDKEKKDKEKDESAVNKKNAEDSIDAYEDDTITPTDKSNKPL